MEIHIFPYFFVTFPLFFWAMENVKFIALYFTKLRENTCVMLHAACSIYRTLFTTHTGVICIPPRKCQIVKEYAFMQFSRNWRAFWILQILHIYYKITQTQNFVKICQFLVFFFSKLCLLFFFSERDIVLEDKFYKKLSAGRFNFVALRIIV